jgi:hypothetical protein
MAIHFNHTIVPAHDSKASATFLAEMLDLPAPRSHSSETDRKVNLCGEQPTATGVSFRPLGETPKRLSGEIHWGRSRHRSSPA